MELRDRVEDARDKFEELHLSWAAGGLSSAQHEEYEWLKTEIDLIKAEALMVLARKSWL